MRRSSIDPAESDENWLDEVEKKATNLGVLTHVWDFWEILSSNYIDERGQTHQFESVPRLNFMTFGLDV